MRVISSYLIGLLFGVGIMIAGMSDPAKVLNFFDLAGSWDPSLAFVMMGAISVTFIGYRFVLRRPSPVLGDDFHLPKAKNLDRRLIGGSALFGIGWGLAGFCPGGSLPLLGNGQVEVLLFVAALILGLGIGRFLTTNFRGTAKPISR